MNAPSDPSGSRDGSGVDALGRLRRGGRLALERGRRTGRRMAGWLASVPREELAIVALLTLSYLIGYLGYPATPGNSSHNPAGWWAWHDQLKQLQAATGLAELHYDGSAHHYPPGYALLAAPFVPWMANHPFFIPNLLCFVGIGLLWFRLARLFLGPFESTALLLLVGWLAKWELQRSLLVPWSTIPTHFIAYLMIWLYLTRSKTPRLVAQLALLDGLAYLCRPGDAGFLLPLVLAAVLEQPRWRDRAAALVKAAAIVALFPLAIAVINQLVAGSTVSDYERVLYQKNGFFTLGPLVKAYVCFVDGLPIYRYGDRVVFERLPWLLACVPGAIWVGRALGWRRAVPPLGAVLASLGLYLGYNAISPISLYPYSLIHYVTWTFPLFGLLSYLTFRKAARALRWPIWVVALALPILLVATVRLQEADGVGATVRDDGTLSLPTPAPGRYDLLVLRGITGRDGHRVAVDGQELRYSVDYHRRRDYGELTHLGGYGVHLREPIAPGAVRFLSPKAPGKTVELRRLRWTIALPSPLLEKLLTGRRDAGVDRLHRTLELVAADLPSLVGEKDGSRGTIRTTAKAGALQFGPYLPLAKGRYVAEWIGVVRAPGTIRLDATADAGKRRLGELSAKLRPGSSVEPEPIARLRFAVGEPVEQAELRLHVDGQVELELAKVVLRPLIRHAP